jgi:hypothetical protein
MAANMTTPSGSMDDTFVISDSDITIDLGNVGAAQSVYTIDTGESITLGNIDWNTIDNTMITGSDTLTWSDNTYTTGYGYNPPNVNITRDGITMQQDNDLKIGDRSLKDFMDKVEDQLAILRPAPELEEKWDQLRDLRKQYEECKQDILEKEKIMEILKRE